MGGCPPGGKGKKVAPVFQGATSLLNAYAYFFFAVLRTRRFAIGRLPAGAATADATLAFTDLRFATLRFAVLRFAALRFGAALRAPARFATLRFAVLRFGAAFLLATLRFGAAFFTAFFLFIAMIFSFFRFGSTSWISLDKGSHQYLSYIQHTKELLQKSSFRFNFP
jgi:hypothetical protein